MQVQIGQKIRELRLRDNRTQAETAEALGVSPQAVSRWVYGKIMSDLADHWPVWTMPDCDDVFAEITADPRWDAWVRRTREEL